jgi:hypothetical protein
MHFTYKAGFALALGCFISAHPAAAQTVYDASADFSTAANPSPLGGGVFSYGAEPTLGGLFALDTQSYTFTGNGSGAAQGWQVAGINYPYVIKNTSTTTNFVNNNGNTTITVVPGQLDLHPGPNGEYSVIRFTAPTTGAFSFSSSFSGVDSDPTTTDVHVLLDGVAIANGGINVSGGGNTATLSSPFIPLTEGDTLDFAVGYGNGTYFNDSTGLYATVTSMGSPVPEASTTVSLGLLLALGLGGFTVNARRRKAQAAG